MKESPALKKYGHLQINVSAVDAYNAAYFFQKL